MHTGDRVHRRALQRVAQHVRLDRGAQRHVEADALLAAGADDAREALAERAVDERQRAAPHAIAHRHLHKAGGGVGADEHRTRRSGEQSEFGRYVLEQFLHPRRTMPDHWPDHRFQNVGMDVGRSGKEEFAERRDGDSVSRNGCGRRHAVARASSSTRPPITTSLVFTSRTPSSPHSLRRCSATSRSMGFIASVTANSRT